MVEVSKKSVIDKLALYECAVIGCTVTDMVHIFRCSSAIFAQPQYKKIIDKARANLRQQLRQAQIKTALEGNPTMLIWLGKQMLEQDDNRGFFVGQAKKEDAAETKVILDSYQTKTLVKLINNVTDDQPDIVDATTTPIDDND